MLARLKKAMSELPPLMMAETAYPEKGFHLDIQVDPAQVVDAAAILNDERFFIEAVTGVDWLGANAAKAAAAKKEAEGEDASPEEAGEPEPPPEEELEVVYDYNHTDELCRVVVRARIPRSNPELPTISEVFPGANWHERETHDFFGIRFAGHPDLTPLLLPEDADFHPLLKDFTA